MTNVKRKVGKAGKLQDSVCKCDENFKKNFMFTIFLQYFHYKFYMASC